MHQPIDCLFNFEIFLSLAHGTYINKITWMKEPQIENAIINSQSKSYINCCTLEFTF